MAKKIIRIENFKLEYEGKNFSVNVPGDVLTDIIQNTDYRFGTGSDFENLKWIHERDWQYTACINFNGDIDGNTVELIFNGIDTIAEIYLNDIFIGNTKNMFLKYTFDVTTVLKRGENTLKVLLKSPWKYLEDNKNHGKYLSIFNEDRVAIRKAQCHFGWDWAPEMPGYGIYLPVEMVIRDNYIIEDAYFKTRATGDITLMCTLGYNVRNKDKSYAGKDTIKVYIGDTIEGINGQPIKTFNVDGRKNLINFSIDNPKLWWPNNYGEQFRYFYRIELVRDGKVLDEKSGRLGIREISIEENPIDDRLLFAVIVNGKKIYCTGSNWVPLALTTGSIDDLRYKRHISMAAEANFNMLRVWGGGIYEKEIFYELCDEYGILVWQDFMFACSDIPDDIPNFTSEITIEAEYQLKRLRNYACIALWCAGNERATAFTLIENKYGYNTSEYLLRGLCNSLTDTPYIPFSPFSYTDVDNDNTSGDVHQCCFGDIFVYNNAENFRDYIYAKGIPAFSSECALMGPCRMRSLKKFIPEDKLWPINEEWHKRFVNNPYSATMPMFADSEKLVADAFFGISENVQDFIKKGMIMHMEIMRAEIDFVRANNAKNSGFLNWMYNDIWPTGTCSVVDYYFERKPVFYAMKRSFSNIYVCVYKDVGGIKAAVINNSDRELAGVLIYGQKKIDGSVVSSNKQAISINPGKSCIIDVLYDQTIEEAYLFAEIEGREDIYQSTYFYRMWKDIDFKNNISVDKAFVKKHDGRYLYEVSIHAESYARTVFIDLPQDTYFEMTDNYFDMQAGQSRSIMIDCEKELSLNDITVKTFNDVWFE